jgi:putative DNA primase/helicase
MLAGGIDREPPVDPVEAALAELEGAADARAAQGPLRRLFDALRGADRLQRATARESALAALQGKNISSPAGLVDAALAGDRPPGSGRQSPAGQGQAVAFADPEPWPELVEGHALLRDIADTLSRYLALPPHAAVAMTLWAIHTHALDAANVAPILALTSPEKRCGKTTALSLLERLVPRPLLSSNISPAALFRSVEKYSPTLLVDEADSVLHEKEELRCILNSSHTRGAAYVVRTVGDDHEPRRFSTWAAKAVALIGRLPDTLADRSVVIQMHRRAPGERVERLRLDRPDAFQDLRRRAARWAADHLAELRALDPEVPGELRSDRATDNWRPLLAIADLAGGEWPELARKAALALSGVAADTEESIRELLLADIRDAFRELDEAQVFTGDLPKREVEQVFTDDLLNCLCGREDRPWNEWKAGRQLSGVQLSRLLKPHGVRPGSLRDGRRTGKGYKRREFADAFTRYLPPSDPSQPSQSNAGAGLPDSPTRHSMGRVTDRESDPNPCGTGFVPGVTDQEALPARKARADGWEEV